MNQPLRETELAPLHASVNRGRPYGQATWMAETARKHGLEHTFREAGRPKKPGGE